MSTGWCGSLWDVDNQAASGQDRTLADYRIVPEPQHFIRSPGRAAGGIHGTFRSCFGKHLADQIE